MKGGWMVCWYVGCLKAQAKELSFDVLSGFVPWSDLYLDNKIGARTVNLTAGATVMNERGISLSGKDLISLGPQSPFLYLIVLLG